MNLSVIVPPPFEPVSMQEAYDHLRWDPEEEGDPSVAVYPLDNLLKRNITTAREWVEEQTRSALVEQTVRLTRGPSSDRSVRRGWDWMVHGYSENWGCIELLKPPFIELVAVRYYDNKNVLQTVDPADYYVTQDLVPKLMFGHDIQMPNLYLRDDAIQIDYKVGYQPAGSPPSTQEDYAANVPSVFKDAILLKVQLLSDRFDPNERADLERALNSLIFGKTIAKF